MRVHSKFWRAVPGSVMVTVLLFVFGFEVANGSLPGSNLPKPLPRADWFNGRATKLIEQSVSKETAFAKLIRPYYLECAWKLAGILTPAVELGKERWLFLPEVVRNYPPSAPEPLIERHAVAIASLSKWLKGQGIEFLVVPVPNKESLATAYLPDVRDRGRPQFRAIVEALARHHVPHVDSSPALSMQLAESWLPNDTHWAPLGALRVAEVVASNVGSMFRGGIPGPAIPTSIDRILGHSFQGDIQRLMGFRKGSWVDQAWNAKVTRVTSVRRSDKRPPLLTGSSIVVAGTSFTHSGKLAEKIGAVLGRDVEDVSRPGVGPVVGLFELLNRVERGERRRPDLVIWEFPERQVFLRRTEFLLPLESWVMAHEPYFSQGETLLGLPVATGGFTHTSTREDSSVVGTHPSKDPWVMWKINQLADSDGSYALHFDLEVNAPIQVKIYLDFGDGISEQATVIRTNTPPGPVTVPLRVSPVKRILQIRLDPGNDGQSFRLRNVALWRRTT